MTFSPLVALHSAFDAAMIRRTALVAQPLGYKVSLDIVENDEFAALIKKGDGGFTLQITTGTAQQLHDLWSDAWGSSTLSVRAAGEALDMTEMSLTWLILHEVEHIYLRHFQIIDASFIAEGDCAHVFDVAERDKAPPLPMLKLPMMDKVRASQCLELQADHEAMDIVLNAFQRETWPDLHQRAVAIAGVILLIERADLTRAISHKTHPPAATRLFQLLGHLCELWLVPAKLAARRQGTPDLDPKDFPSDDEIQEFRQAVCVPAFTDTLSLATLADSKTIATDLGDIDGFFWDVAIASTADPEKFGDLRTQGARHLMNLMPLNGPILQALGHQGLP